MTQSIMVEAGSGHLVLKGREYPKVGRRQVLVEIHASSMNPHDWKFYSGFKNTYRNFPFLPDMMLGHDLSGVVIETGSKVKNFEVGDQVFAMSAKTGAFGEHLAIDERMLAHKPENLNHIEAATVPMAALTAWQAFILTKLEAGEQVLVIGGSGGVGIYAIQIARVLGAKVTAVCSTTNVELVKSLGADVVVDYTKEDYHQLQTHFDIVFDVIGGQSKASCADILKADGEFISTNTSLKNITEVFSSRLQRLLSKNTVNAQTFLAMPIGRHLAEIARMIEANQVKPLVDKVFELSDIESAISYSKQGRTKGKIALKVR